MTASVYDFLWCDAPDDTNSVSSASPSRRHHGGEVPTHADRITLGASVVESISDAELIDRIRARDDSAFELLVRARYDRMVQFAAGLTHSADSAQDIVQDVFVWVWDQGDRWQPRGSLAAYFFAAVRNAALNHVAHLRVVERHVSRVQQSPALHEASSDGGVVHAVEHAERMAALHRAVQSLTERQRTAFQLRYEQQLTVAQVAEVLEISPKGAERMLTRVIVRLRAALAHLR
jgi:RNA polymerase sigma-70 factor (ECF subfamily)